MFLLAEEPTVSPEQAVGLLERLTKGGVPLICLAVAVVACAAAWWALKKWIKSEREKADLEKTYRLALEAQAKQDKVDAAAQLAEAKREAEARRQENEKLFRERMAVEKESAETLAHAVQMVEACGRTLERVERRLDKAGG